MGNTTSQPDSSGEDDKRAGDDVNFTAFFNPATTHTLTGDDVNFTTFFSPATTHFTMLFALKARIELVQHEAIFTTFQPNFHDVWGDICQMLHWYGVHQVGKNWGSREIWIEVTFSSEKKLKKFLQSRRKVEMALSEIIMETFKKDAPTPTCETSTELYLLGPDLPEKIRKVTLANCRSSATLFAKSKVFKLPSDAEAEDVAVPEDTLIQEDLPEMVAQLAEVADWYLLGLFLKVPPHRLREIEQDVPPRIGSTERRLTEVLLVWMDMINPEEVKWSTLVAALANMGMKGCARRIASEYGVECPAETSLDGVMSSEEGAKFQQTLQDIGELIHDVDAKNDQLLRKQQLLEKSQKERVVRVEALQCIKETLSDTINKAKALGEEKAELDQKLTEKEQQLREKERELEQLLQQRRDGSQKEVRLLEENIADLRLQVSDLRSEVSDLKQHLTAKEEELRAAKEEVNNLCTQLSQTSAELAAKTQTIHSLEEEQHIMEVQLNSERVELEKCRHEVLSMSGSLVAVKQVAEFHIRAAEQRLRTNARITTYAPVPPPNARITYATLLPAPILLPRTPSYPALTRASSNAPLSASS